MKKGQDQYQLWKYSLFISLRKCRWIMNLTKKRSDHTESKRVKKLTCKSHIWSHRYFPKARWPTTAIFNHIQWHPTPVLLPGKSHGRRSLVGCSPWGRWGSDTTEQLHLHFSLSCIGEGNGKPLQCSCLENPRDGGAWWAAVYGVAQSRTRLKRLSSSSSIIATVCHSETNCIFVPTYMLSGYQQQTQISI